MPALDVLKPFICYYNLICCNIRRNPFVYLQINSSDVLRGVILLRSVCFTEHFAASRSAFQCFQRNCSPAFFSNFFAGGVVIFTDMGRKGPEFKENVAENRGWIGFPLCF